MGINARFAENPLPLAASIAKLEADIEAAEEKGDTARVTFLERQLEITETEFDAAEANYVKKEDELRNATRNASATMAEDATNFFDRVATEGGYEQREIVIGDSSELFVVIEEGLVEGEQVLLREPLAGTVARRLGDKKDMN